MSEWWTYELSDFLLFSHRVYVRLFEIHNAAVWPAQLATLLIGTALFYALMRPGPLTARLVPLSLGALWIWVAWSFFVERYATINWAAMYVAPVFVLQGVVLAVVGLRQGLDLAPNPKRRLSAVAAGIVLALCVAAYPLMAPALGRPPAAAEIFGITPDPTAVGTLAMLSVARGRFVCLLMIVPLAWVVLSGLTLWTMGAAEAAVAPMMSIVIAAVTVARRRHA